MRPGSGAAPFRMRGSRRARRRSRADQDGRNGEEEHGRVQERGSGVDGGTDHPPPRERDLQRVTDLRADVLRGARLGQVVLDLSDAPLGIPLRVAAVTSGW